MEARSSSASQALLTAWPSNHCNELIRNDD
jgi:hypothetical protein